MSKKLIKIILIAVGVFVVVPLLVIAGTYLLIIIPYIQSDRNKVLRPQINSCFAISREGQMVYALRYPGDLPVYYEMKSADSKTFKPLGDSCYAVDSHQAYFEDKILIEADPIHLRLIEGEWISDNERDYATDGSTVFYKNQRVENIDAKTVRYFKYGWEALLDKDSLFYYGVNMGHVDTATLTFYDEVGRYLKDKQKVYFMRTQNPLQLVTLEGVKPSASISFDGTLVKVGDKTYREGELVR